jgi:hypothetical protein
MKIVQGVIVSIIIIFMFTGFCFAQGKPAITIGASYWRAALDYQESGDMNLDIDPGNMYGPYLNLRFGKITIGSSIFLGGFKFNYGDYLMPVTVNGYSYDAYGDMYVAVISDYAPTVKRTDINFSLGYNLTRRISIFGAYKSMKLKRDEETYTGNIYTWDYIYDIYYDEGQGEITTESFEIKGGYYGGGLSLLLPFVNSPLFAFGSAAYLAANDKDNTDITAFTAGLGYYSKSGLTIMAGYRADLSGEGEGQEKINGFMATMAYTVR